jgi:ribosome recycling factor
MDFVSEAKQSMHMQKVIEVLKNDLATVRTGRASSSLVENISVSVYGGTARMKIIELATISVPDQHALLITPYDGSIIGEIKKGIEEANTGMTPVISEQNIRIAIPPLSEERRKELIHLMKQKLENGKIMLRQQRHDAMDQIKKQEADNALTEDDKTRLEKDVQKLTDDYSAEVDAMGKKKEEELLQI